MTGMWLLGGAILVAQSYTMPQAVVANGGSAIAGGPYRIVATIGEPGAGAPLTGGPYSVAGGFWTFAGECPAIGLSATTLNSGTVGSAYPASTLTQTGGAGAVIFSITTGTLPPGMTLSTAGVVAGTPTGAGTYDFTVTATDVNGCTGSRAYSLTIVPPPPPTMALDIRPLVFGAVSNGTSFTSRTAAQLVLLKQSGAGTVTWTATSSKPWLTVSPASGTGSATLSIAVTFVAGLAATETGSVTLAFSGSGSVTGPIPVTLNVSSGSSAVPFGSFDTPVNLTAGAAGSIAVTGWALDDVEVAEVQLWRDPHPNDPPGAIFGGPGPQTGQVFIGYGTFVEGARPDVEALYPTTPRKSRAGWGYLMLTRGLIWDGQGMFKLYAYAVDRDGHVVRLGANALSIDNSVSTRPFGAIDTPGQGATAGGLYPNTGWVLTPNAGATIPAANVQVAIDGVFLDGIFSMSDRSDITNGFAGFNTTGAGRGLFLDLSGYPDGPHTIGWLVTDTLGKADGIGSRFFTVSNGINLTAGARLAMAPAFELQAAASCGVTRDTLAGLPGAGAESIVVEELARLERHVESEGGLAGYALVDGEPRALPIGSHLDSSTGVFTWQLGPGFLGRHELVFVGCAGGTAVSRRDLTITIVPKR